MKRLLAASAALLWLTACDDLGTMPEDPYAPPPISAPTGPPPQQKVLNRATMEEVFNYTANIHETMHQYRDALSAMPDQKSDDWIGKKNHFLYETANWRHLLAIRQEWMSMGNFGDDHPSRKIKLAIYYLMEESKHLENVFHHGVKLNPQFQKDIENALREAARALENYRDPPGP